MKKSTRLVIGHVIRNLKAYFGERRPLETVTPAECDDFRRWLETPEKLAPATVGKRVEWASAFFRDGFRRKLISENPFEDVKRPRASNPERQRYIDRETIARVIETCPNSEWRLLVTMSRYLGLRTPSEPLSLKWDDVDWARSRLWVTNITTARYDGRAYRWVPILPEVRVYLDEVYAQAGEGDVFILANLRKRASLAEGIWHSVNLRTQFTKIVRRAGFEPWPKLWHNLRASVQTDLAARFPLHVVCRWLDNSKAIAGEHYLQVTDADYERALIPVESSARQTAQSGVVSAVQRASPEPKNAETPISQGVSEENHGGGRTRIPVGCLAENEGSSEKQRATHRAEGQNCPSGAPLEVRLLRAFGRLAADDRRALVEGLEGACLDAAPGT